MLCKSFVKLCYKLGTYITTQQTHLRKPIDVEKQVSIVFHYLADEGRIRKVSNSIGVGNSSVIDYSSQ